MADTAIRRVYEELREAVSSRDRIVKELGSCANRIKRWLKIYFPEYLKVYRNIFSESGMTVLETAPLPQNIIHLGTGGVNGLRRAKKLRAVGMKRAMTLVETAHNSVGLQGGACAWRITAPSRSSWKRSQRH